MFRSRKYHYLVDGLNDEKAEVLRKSLATVAGIRRYEVSVGRSTVEAEAERDVSDEVRLACDVAGIHFRTRARL